MNSVRFGAAYCIHTDKNNAAAEQIAKRFNDLGIDAAAIDVSYSHQDSLVVTGAELQQLNSIDKEIDNYNANKQKNAFARNHLAQSAQKYANAVTEFNNRSRPGTHILNAHHFGTPAFRTPHVTLDIARDTKIPHLNADEQARRELATLMSTDETTVTPWDLENYQLTIPGNGETPTVKEIKA